MNTALVTRLTASEIHDRLAGRWPELLEHLGIESEYLTNKHGPCPGCGGTDRYRFDDKHQRGDFYCNGCGAGDGFKLLQIAHRWTFAEARRAVLDAMGGSASPAPKATTPQRQPAPDIAMPTSRVQTLLRTSSAPESVPAVIAYLRSRKLWPLPSGCTWRAHVGVDYFKAGEGKSVVQVGRFPALVAAVRDVDDELVTAHITYLAGGAKLTEHDPRKILSPMSGRRGCAVRLLPLDGEALGLAEGIETALAASILHDNMPVWSTLNAVMLSKFAPPPGVHRVIIFADRDVAGLEAAYLLREHLDGRCQVELRIPPAPAGDWADVWAARP